MLKLVWQLVFILSLFACDRPLKDLFLRAHGDVSEGNAFYKKKAFDNALKRYGEAARELPLKKGVDYNSGLGWRRKEDSAKARAALAAVFGGDALRAEKVRSYFVLGNSYFDETLAKAGEQDFENALESIDESIDAYMRGLRALSTSATSSAAQNSSATSSAAQNSSTTDKNAWAARESLAWNYELARRLKEELKSQRQQQKEQQEQEQQEQEDDQNSENEDGNQSEDDDSGQDKSEQNKPEESDESEEQQEGDENSDESQSGDEQEEEQKEPNTGDDEESEQAQPEQKESKQPYAPPKPKSEAERVLDSVQSGEKNMPLERARQGALRGKRKVEKDW